MHLQRVERLTFTKTVFAPTGTLAAQAASVDVVDLAGWAGPNRRTSRTSSLGDAWGSTAASPGASYRVRSHSVDSQVRPSSHRVETIHRGGEGLGLARLGSLVGHFNDLDDVPRMFSGGNTGLTVNGPVDELHKVFKDVKLP